MEELDANVQTVMFFLYVPLAGGVSLCGLVGNIINITVFSRQGLQDSASVCLLLLSTWDLGVCVSTVLYGLSFAIDRLAPPTEISIYDLALLDSSLPRQYFGQMSMCTTVVMSLERCLCVARPLTFKNVINRRNTIILLGLLYLEVSVVSLAQYMTYTMSWQWDNILNATRLKLDMKNGPESLSVTVSYLLNNVTVTTASMTVVVVCTCVMVSGLRAAGRFRHRQAAIPTANSTILKTTPSVVTTHTMSSKEARLVKMVTLVSIIFLMCNAPVMAILVAKRLVIELNMYGRYHNLNEILWAFLYFTAAINATLTICVYMKTSSNYQSQIAKLCVRNRFVQSK